MSKFKKTAVPLPGLQSKSKRKTSPTPDKSALSQEFINDSDDSSDEPATAPPLTKSVQIGVNLPKANGTGKAVAKTSVGTKTTKSKDHQKAASAKAPPTKPVPKRVTAEAEAVESTSSSEESEDEGADINTAQQRKPAGIVDTGSEDTSSSSAESSSEESEVEAAPNSSAQQLPRRPKPAQSRVQIVEFQATQPYVPPKDFIAASTTRSAESAPANSLRDLQGKHVWHITAPGGLSLKDLQQVAMAQAIQGGAIINQDGIAYGFLANGNEETVEKEVLIPSQSGYETVLAPISRTLNIREMVNLPKLSSKQTDPNTGSEAAASITRSSIRAPRPQVKGLKMRYFPSGTGDHTPTTLGLSDSEDNAPAAQPAGLGVPSEMHVASKPEKRKHADVHGHNGIENPTKKHKKHRTVEEAQKKLSKKARKEEKRKHRHEGHARSKS